MEPSMDEVLVSIIVGMWILAMVRLALTTENKFGCVLADLLSIAAGCAAGGLVYWWL